MTKPSARDLASPSPSPSTRSTAAPGRCVRYVAVGDSFTEGVGDSSADGHVRGWADLVAAELSRAGRDEVKEGAAFGYANLAVRGKLLGQIVDEQVEAALQLEPDLVSFSGGGNDILRPRSDIQALLRLQDQVIARFRDRGVHMVLFTGADPSAHLPLGKMIRSHGDRYAEGIRAMAARRDCLLVDLWSESELQDRRYWDVDRLHLNVAGHRQVAARVLQTLGQEAPADWLASAPELPQAEHRLREEALYYRGYVLPWVQRRLTGRSSGDTLTAKRPVLSSI